MVGLLDSQQQRADPPEPRLQAKPIRLWLDLAIGGRLKSSSRR